MTDKPSSTYHDGQRELQDRFDGRRIADALEKHRCHTEFTEEDIQFIEQSEFFFLATAHDETVDCSFKGGHAGFVRVTGPRTLEWSDYDGNSMYRSLGNIQNSPSVGLLFITFGKTPKRLRVNGSGTFVNPDAVGNTKLIVQVEVDRIFPNCPRYIPDFTKNASSPFLPDENGVGAKPKWKSAEDFRDALPDKDPHRI